MDKEKDKEMIWNKYKEDFLWFSYFGVTKDDVENLNEAILTCSRRAYADLSRTLDYKYSVSDLNKGENIGIRKSFETWKTCFRCTVDGKIVERVKELLGMDSLTKDGFDEWHKDMCEDIRYAGTGSKPREIDDEVFLFGKKDKNTNNNEISYGQAQKWVNMTLKNLLVMGKINYKEHKSIIESMHIPLDSYIYGAAAVDKGKKIYKSMDVEGLGISHKEMDPWSKIKDYGCKDTVNSYMWYQNEVRKACGKEKTPIEWECDAWIAQAKKEQGK